MIEQKTAKRKKFDNIIRNLYVVSLVVSIGVIVFLASLLAILYAGGKKPTTAGIVTTGDIRVNSEFPNLEIKLNGTTQPSGIKLISNLEPGEYDLEVRSNGYETWAKKVKVSPTLVSDVYVQLVPTAETIVTHSDLGIDKIFYSPLADYAYYIVNSSKSIDSNGIWKQRISDPSQFEVFETSKPFKFSALVSAFTDSTSVSETTTNTTATTTANTASAPTETASTPTTNTQLEIIPSSDNSKVIIINQKKEYFILDTNKLNEEKEIVTLNSTLDFPIKSISWAKGSETVVIESDNMLVEYNVASKRATIVEYETTNDLTYAVHMDRILFFDNNQKKLRYYQNGEYSDSEVFARLAMKDVKKIAAPSKNPDIFYYQTSNGAVYFVDMKATKQSLISEISDSMSVSNDGLSLIIRDTKGESQVFNANLIRSNGKYTPEINPLKLANGMKITNARFASSSNNILLTDVSSKVYLADSDGENQKELLESEKDAKVSGVTTNTNMTKVYYLTFNKDLGHSTLKYMRLTI